MLLKIGFHNIMPSWKVANALRYAGVEWSDVDVITFRNNLNKVELFTQTQNHVYKRIESPLKTIAHCASRLW